MIANNDGPSDNKEDIKNEIGSKILKLLGQEWMEHDLDLGSGAEILFKILDHMKKMDQMFTIIEKAKAQFDLEGDSNGS